MREATATSSADDLSTQSHATIEDMAHRFWSASRSIEVVRELSHWLDIEIWKTDDRLLQYAKSHLDMFVELCEKNSRPLFDMQSMMEWGPGGGANAVVFAPYMKRFVGVDISLPNLEECIRQLAARKLLQKTLFSPIIVDISTPETALELLHARVDFFLSTAVYQHFPSMDYGIRVTKIANKALKPGGLAVIQTRLNDGTEAYRSKNEDYVKKYAAFTCYTEAEFTHIAEDCGFEVQGTHHKADVRYVFYLLKKIAELN